VILEGASVSRGAIGHDQLALVRKFGDETVADARPVHGVGGDSGAAVDLRSRGLYAQNRTATADPKTISGAAAVRASLL